MCVLTRNYSFCAQQIFLNNNYILTLFIIHLLIKMQHTTIQFIVIGIGLIDVTDYRLSPIIKVHVVYIKGFAVHGTLHSCYGCFNQILARTL